MRLFRRMNARPFISRQYLAPLSKSPLRVFSEIPKPHWKEWTTHEVLQWATKIPGINETHVRKLEEQELTGSNLFKINEERLKECGLPMGPRIKIMDEIQKLKIEDIRQQLRNQTMTSLYGKKMAFQNNHGNILKIATAILENLTGFNEGKDIRYRQLISAHEAYGSGKTRIAQEALIRIRQLLQNNPDTKEKLETKYGTDMVQFLQNNMMLVYMDVSKTEVDDKVKNGFPTFVASAVADHLRISIPSQFQTISDFQKWISEILPRDIGLFIVLDEFSSYVGKVAQSKNQPVTIFHNYNIWTEKIQYLQEIHNTTVFISGRGAYLEALGQGRFVGLRSPTEVVPLRLQAFNIDDLHEIVDNTPELKIIGDYLRTVGMLDTYLHQLLKVTGGVPIFVHYCLMENHPELLKATSVSDVEKYLDHQVKLVPHKIRFPFKQFANRPGAMRLYKTLMIASIFNLTIIDQDIPLSKFTEEEKKEFEAFSSVNLMDLAVILNCYIQEVPNDKGGQYYKLIFPEEVIDQYRRTVNDFKVPLVDSLL